ETNSDTANKRKIYAMYKSFMDEARLESLGITPLKKSMEVINNIKNISQIPQLIASLAKIGVTTPISIDIQQDARNSSLEVVNISQSGLGLPDRDYYLKADDKTLSLIKQKYLEHISKMLALYGDGVSRKDANNIVELETKLAKIQWTNVQNRDPIKTYNKVSLNKLKVIMPHYNWNKHLKTANLDGKITYVIVNQPSYLTEFDKILQETPLQVWQAYFKWHLLSDYAPFLSKSYADENFNFYGTNLRGIPKQEPRYK
ncbi:MAG: Peptidase, partial [Burkholderiales bacterium]|nr:Peptidase [Burkholderiales bacterium]